MELGEVTIKAVEDKVKLVEAWVEAKKLKEIAKAKLKAIEDFKALPDFEAKVAEGFSIAYMYGF